MRALYTLFLFNFIDMRDVKEESYWHTPRWESAFYFVPSGSLAVKAWVSTKPVSVYSLSMRVGEKKKVKYFPIITSITNYD